VSATFRTVAFDLFTAISKNERPLGLDRNSTDQPVLCFEPQRTLTAIDGE
jgi:hypothetical protein